MERRFSRSLSGMFLELRYGRLSHMCSTEYAAMELHDRHFLSEDIFEAFIYFRERFSVDLKEKEGWNLDWIEFSTGQERRMEASAGSISNQVNKKFKRRFIIQKVLSGRQEEKDSQLDASAAGGRATSSSPIDCKNRRIRPSVVLWD